MSIRLEIPINIGSKTKFSLAITNETEDVVDVTLKLDAAGAGQEFAVRQRPKAKTQIVAVGPNATETFVVSEWGDHAAGTAVVMTGNDVPSNKAAVIT